MSTCPWQLDDASHGVQVRPLQETDAEALTTAVIAAVPTVGRWMDWCRPDYTRDTALTWIRYCQTQWAAPWGEREFGIFDRVDGALLGCAGINQINTLNSFGNLGYWIRPEAVGRGLASRVADWVARFGFEQMGLVRLELVIRVDNAISRRVAEKLGAHFEAIMRSRLMFEGGAHDAAMYGLLPADLSGR